MKEPLPDKTKKYLRWSFYIITPILIIINSLSLGLIGKNITYTSRLTPPSLSPQLSTASIYLYSQVSFLILGLLFNLSLLSNSYATFKLKKKLFRVNLAILVVLWIGCLFVIIAFLTGSSDYQAYMQNQISQTSTWDNCNNNICSAATCARLRSYEGAHGMGIAFAVIAAVLGAAVIPISYLLNGNRIQELQLLER